MNLGWEIKRIVFWHWHRFWRRRYHVIYLQRDAEVARRFMDEFDLIVAQRGTIKEGKVPLTEAQKHALILAWETLTIRGARVMSNYEFREYFGTTPTGSFTAQHKQVTRRQVVMKK